MKYTCVLPFNFAPWKDKCMKDCKLENVLLIDNTVDNIGVAASWNKGIDKMREQGSDWLIIISAAIRFGDEGGMDFIRALEGDVENVAVEAGMGLGWHLIAFRKDIIERAGRFDENFYPAYFEDVDYGWRIAKATHKVPPYWTKVTVDAGIAGWGHGVELGGAERRDNSDYMIKKWGGLTGGDLYENPFNDPNNSIQYWPSSEWTKSTWDA